MHRHALPLLLAALSFGACLPFGESADSGTPDAGPTSDPGPVDAGPAPLPKRVLIASGHGGVGPEGMWGDMTHADTTAMYQQAGLQVTSTDSWPTSLDEHRLVILPAPGFKDAAARFSAAEVQLLRSFLTAGGVVAVELENTGVLDPACANQLFTDLGLAVRMGTGWANGTADHLVAHPLLQGVTKLGLSASAVLELNGETCRAATATDCLVVAHAIGAGYLVVIADGNTVSSLADWDTAGADNRRFLRNLARLP